MKILIVDDEKLGRDSLQTVLSVFDYDVKTAANGPEAITIADSFHPDIAVIDWMLGHHLDGINVADILKTSLPSLQIVIISGQADVSKQITADTPYHFLMKPFQLPQLLALFEEVSKQA